LYSDTKVDAGQNRFKVKEERKEEAKKIKLKKDRI
jgi:hypothetical protein